MANSRKPKALASSTELPIGLRKGNVLDRYDPASPMAALGGLPAIPEYGIPSVSLFPQNTLAGGLNTPFMSPTTALNELAYPGIFGNPSVGGVPSGFMSTMWGKAKGLAGDFAPKVDPVSGKLSSMGWGMPFLQGLSAIGSLVDSRKQYKLAKDQLNFSKEAFYTNLANQRKLTNMEMENAHNRRLSAGTTTEPLVDYMKRYGV